MSEYKFYKFKGQDPLIREVVVMIDGEKASVVAKQTGVSTSTVYNWRKKKTKRAFVSTLSAVGGAQGMKLKWTRSND